MKVVDLDLSLKTKLEREFKDLKINLKKLQKNKIIDMAYELVAKRKLKILYNNLKSFNYYI